jgi:hypothetical protein
MRLCDDPLSLTPEERLREVARLLAAGVLRLRAHPARAAGLAEHPGPENTAKTERDCLEVPGETVLSVQNG